MKNKVRPNQRVTVDEACDNLAQEGLRTLVISQKIMTEKDFEEWNNKYIEAQADLNDRETKVRACIDELEHEMELLGITGVEGKLSIYHTFQTSCKRK